MKAFFFLCTLLLAACGGGGGGGTPGDGDSDAVATPKGVADGNPVTATLGPDGGSLISPDGRMTLTIPAGALAMPTEISIQPIASTCPHSLGGAYRLMPEGVTFAQPVQISFHYSDSDLTDTTPDGLGIAFQDSLGFWQSVNAATVNIAATTVTVSTTHFSDWSFFRAYKITPRSGTVKVKNSIGVTVLQCGCTSAKESDELCALRSTCRPMAVSVWTVNGLTNGNANVGTVSSNGNSVTYTAPASTLSIGVNPVAVSAEITFRNLKGKGMLISSIKVVDDNTWIGTSTARHSSYWGVGAVLTAQVTWTPLFDSDTGVTVSDTGVTYFWPSGTVTAVSEDESCAFSPSSWAIAPDENSLEMNFMNNPPSGSFWGVKWGISLQCPNSFVGGGLIDWLIVPEGSVSLSADGLTIAGKFENENGTVFEWSFTRQQ